MRPALEQYGLTLAGLFQLALFVIRLGSFLLRRLHSIRVILFTNQKGRSKKSAHYFFISFFYKF